MAATLAAINVTRRKQEGVSKGRWADYQYLQLGDEGLAVRLRALELLFLPIRGWVSTKELECEVLVVFALLRCQRLEPLQFHECFGAVTPALIKEASNDHDTVDLSCGEFFLVLNESHCCLHGGIVLPIKHMDCYYKQKPMVVWITYF